MKKTSSKNKKVLTYPRKADDVSVNRKMLFSVRDELKYDIKAMRIDFGGFRNEMASMRAESKSEFHRLSVLIEDQNNRNKIVLDGLAHMIARQDHLEARFTYSNKP